MRLFVDLTCCWEEAGRIAHGTLRVERGLASAFLALSDEGIGFMRFDRARDAFVALPRETVSSLLGAPTHAERRRAGRPAWRQGGLFAVGRALERWVRDRVRAPLRKWIGQRTANATPSDRAQTASSLFAPGDVLFLPGELRQSQHALRDLRASGVRLALVFYDLLEKLPDGDLRLSAASNAKLPSSDFTALYGDIVFAISRYSANVLERHLVRRGLKPRGIEIIRLASDLDPAMTQQRCEGLIASQFVLCVGDVNPRKNQRLLVDVWRKALHHGVALPKLVIVGRVDGVAAELVRLVRAEPALSALIVFKTNVADAELAWLYSHCRFTVFPSLDEGFGLPVAESLSFGKLCVASDAAAIPEASQGFALHLDPQDAAIWRETIGALACDDQLVAEHEARIRAGFRCSTWDDAARTVLNATSRD